MNARRRWLVWLPLLAVAGWLAAFGNTSPAAPEVSLPTRPAARATDAVRGEPAAESLVALVPRSTLVPDAGAEPPARDPFSARSWRPAAPAQGALAAPAAPTAPAPPYAFVGKKQEAGAWEVFLARGEQNFLAREGQVLEGQWRVDQVQPPTLTLTYLPLDARQTLAIGEAP